MLADNMERSESLFSGTYAIHVPMTKKVNLSFGVKAGLSNNSLASQAQVLNIMAPEQINIMIQPRCFCSKSV